jgi:hypothetical protein
MKNNKFFLIILIALNSIVLLGQVWPQGAPPFASYVNITALILNLILLISLIKNK